MAKQTRAERIVHANQLLLHISSFGRRFFYYARENRVAAFELTSSGRVRFRDECTNLLVDTSRTVRWNPQKFSGGGTMQSLLTELGAYVSKGVKMDRRHFGPWADWVNAGDRWGYGFEEMEKLRAAISDSDCIDHKREG